jgi:3-hydroxybutyryl-CoA dehydrogenase
VIAAGVRTLAVIGSGTMGSGIAETAARFERRVLLVDVAAPLLDKSLAAIGRSLQRAVEKGKLAEDQKAALLRRIEPTTDLARAGEADFIIEAVFEDESAKKTVLAQLDAVARPGVILASNTSSIPITRLASATKRPDLVIGMHFMNPVPVMKLVEVIRGLATSDETCRETVQLAEAMEKTPVEVNDYPGFVSNRILMPMINEAVTCLMEGVAGPREIDTVMKLGMNHPMGPLELADFIGLDVCLGIMEVLHRGLGDDKYRPCPMLRRYVDAGRLGRKSGRGFYEYAKG